MQRTKLLAIAVAAFVAAGGASLYFLGSAQAASWHDYKGDMYAGHAYGLHVPMSAQSYEIRLEGDAGATAALALFDSEGAALGYHALDAATPVVTIAEPAEGRHVAYVYDVQGGALKLRVEAPLAPVTASLQTMPLFESRLPLVTSDGAAPLALSETKDLRATPVFLTLLYEGSVRGLDATIASAKGDVVTIRGESGTAFSPGVWSHLTGERRTDFANLDGAAFTIQASAERFEGSLILTTLSIDHEAPAAPEAAPAPTPAPIPVNGAFAAPEGTPIAFQATAGAIRITKDEPIVQKDREDEHEHGSHRKHWSGTFAIYRPDDTLLAFVTLSDREPNATVKLPTDGEYVVFVHDAPKDGFLVQLVGASSMGGVRELATVEEVFDLDVSSGLRDEGETFTLTRAPIRMTASLDESTVGAVSWAQVENENGVVAVANTFLKAAGLRTFEWSYQEPENFAAGDHVLRVQGVMEGKLHLVSVSYLRQDAPAEPAEPVAPPAEGSLLGLLGL